MKFSAFLLALLLASPALARNPGATPFLGVQDGGTGAADAAGARSKLGVGTFAVDQYGFASLTAPDGSPGIGKQVWLGSGITPVEFISMQHGTAGHGATLLCSSPVSSSVFCNYIALVTGSHSFGNGHGEMLRIADPGGAITATPQITPGTAASPAATYGSDGNTVVRSAPGAYSRVDLQVGDDVVFHATPTTATISKPLIALGTTSGSNPSAGNIGELISASLVVGSGVAPTNNTPTNILTITLTPGNWDVTGSCGFRPANTSVMSYGICSITAASATFGRPDLGGYGNKRTSWTGDGSTIDGIEVGPRRVNVTTNTTYYLIGQTSFSASGVMYGRIDARRVP